MHMWTSPVLLFFLIEPLFTRKRTLAEITVSLQTSLNPLSVSFVVGSVEVRGREQTYQPIKANNKFKKVYNINREELRITFPRTFYVHCTFQCLYKLKLVPFKERLL